MTDRLSSPSARRIALAAQGFGRPHPTVPTARHLRGALDRLQVLQIDSVNVFERSHYLPLFARLGAYDRAAADRLLLAGSADYLEYWAHQAAFIARRDRPLFGFRMSDFRDQAVAGRRHSWAAENEPMLAWLRAELAGSGPLLAREIEHEANTSTGSWWGWSDVKRGLEYLFLFGEVVSAGRDRFQRRYALAEQVLTTTELAVQIPRADAVRTLVERAGRALGVGTLADLGDYWRLSTADTTSAVRDLEDAGVLVPVTVEGWLRGDRPEKAWVHRDARRPRRIETEALLSPFDPVVWFRPRGERLFGFHYRIEIYTPEPQRVFGYYVLPVLVDDELVGRIDLKNDRQNRVLRVQSAWLEPGHPRDVAERIAPLLARTAAWLHAESILVSDRGTLAEPLRAAVAALP